MKCLSIIEISQILGGISNEEICHALLAMAKYQEEEDVVEWDDSTWEAWAELYEDYSCYSYNNKPR